jgi:hypothetical protein
MAFPCGSGFSLQFFYFLGQAVYRSLNIQYKAQKIKKISAAIPNALCQAAT